MVLPRMMALCRQPGTGALAPMKGWQVVSYHYDGAGYSFEPWLCR